MEQIPRRGESSKNRAYGTSIVGGGPGFVIGNPIFECACAHRRRGGAGPLRFPPRRDMILAMPAFCLSLHAGYRCRHAGACCRNWIVHAEDHVIAIVGASRNASRAVSTAFEGAVPKVRRQHLPPALFQRLLDRIQSRQIPATQLGLLAKWLDTEPEVPGGQWYKRFSGMTVCGEGELLKTLLLPGQAPKGARVS